MMKKIHQQRYRENHGTRMAQRSNLSAGYVLAVTVVFAVSILATTSSAQTQLLKGCRGTEICDLSVSGSGIAYDNCQSCGTKVLFCGGVQTAVPRECKAGSGFTAQCVDGSATCTGAGDPNKILKFTVYSPQDLLFTGPIRHAAIAGRTVDYKITIENKNPVPVDILLINETPDEPGGWKAEYPSVLQLAARAKREITVRVTSPAGAPDADYPIVIRALGFQADDHAIRFAGSIALVYQVASRSAPELTVEPTTQAGIPGQKVVYMVNVTNADPPDFDRSSIALGATGPEKWQTVLASRSVQLRPGESSLVRLEVTPDVAAREQAYEIVVNATANGMSSLATISHRVSFCGDGVCGVSEQCTQDCPLETDFVCAGRCERETDTGVDFSATVKFSYSTFIICKKGTTPDACRSAFNSRSCGFGKDCLCGSALGESSCGIRCVDSAGAYYLFASDPAATSAKRSAANYSFSCPFVNLDELKGLRTDFNSAKQSFDQARSGLKENLNTASRDDKQKLQPCYDGLGEIIMKLQSHIAYLDDVIKNPAVSNTTEARTRSSLVRREVDQDYNLFCRGATGALRITNLQPPGRVERNKNAAALVTVRNTGTINYYGYVMCDFTSPRGAELSVNTTCTPLSANREVTFDPHVMPEVTGSWKLQCRVIGSLKSDCSSEVHDQSPVINFDVFSRDTFVKDVTGTCTADGATCTVRLSTPFGCGGCQIDNRECSRLSVQNDTVTFSCPRAIPGSYNLTGYVIPTSECVPVEPANKTARITCIGCGDGIVQRASEQCEMPGTDNNPQCGQTEVSIENGRRGARDRFGFCTPTCQCSADPFSFSCIKGVGGATCSDGETRVVTKTVNGQQASCIEHCGPVCVFDNCTVEAVRGCFIDADCSADKACIFGLCTLRDQSGPGTGGGPISNGTPGVTLSVSVSHVVSGSTAVITALSNGALIHIFVDGIRVAECEDAPCSYQRDFSPGSHTYFAVARNSQGVPVSDPSQGTKSFTIGGGGATPVPPSNATITTPTENITVAVAHSPSQPVLDDLIRIAATASRPVDRIDVFVDNFLSRSCNLTASCNISQRLSAGLHSYHALFTRNGTAARAQGQVFVSLPSVVMISQIDVPETVIAGGTASLVFDLQNPDAARFGRLRCLVQTPTQVRTTSGSCNAIPSGPSRQELVFTVGELGVWNVTSCDINVSTRSDCAISAVHDVEINVGAFVVTQPTDVFISNVRVPTIAVIGRNTSLNVTVQNPQGSAQFVRTSCSLRAPDGGDVQLTSTCAGVSPNASRAFGFTFLPNQLGTWQIVSCDAETSSSADCAGASRTHRLALARPLQVVKSDQLEIMSTALSATGTLTIGEPASVAVQVRNPTETDRFAQVSCTFRTQSQANLINSTACSLLRRDATDTFTVTITPPFVGRWNVTSCTVSNSLNVDCSNGRVDDTASNIGMFEVSSSQIGPVQGNGSSGPGGSTGGGNTTAKCEILRFRPECVFSTSTNRYSVSAEISWNGGDHAHVVIDGDDGARIFETTARGSKVIATPGPVSVRAEVHNANDDVRCSKPTQEVLCVAGNLTSDGVVQVVRNMPETSRPGPVAVQLFVSALDAINDFQLTEYVPAGLPVSNIIVTGNHTAVRQENFTTSSLGSTGLLRALRFNISLLPVENVTITYTVMAAQEGEYQFFFLANASGQVTQERPFTLFVTSCPQITKVYATGAGGSCQSFRTSCDVPPGWVITESCFSSEPSPGTPEPGGVDGMLVAVVVIIIVLIVVLGYRNRELIRERLQRFRNRKSPEEFPTFDDRQGARARDL